MIKFHIPYTFQNIEVLKKKSVNTHLVKHKKNSRLQDYLDKCNVDITREEYLTICRKTFVRSFIIFNILLGTALYFFKVERYVLISLGASFLLSFFMYLNQIIYPKIYSSRKQRNIEKNIIPALEDMLVQLNSGVPLFNIMVNVSSSDYGELSVEFKKAVKKISSGLPQIDVLEELGEKNPSPYFKRAIWQISNGMRAGSDIAIVISDTVHSLNEEQLIQIQNYGNKLNPLIMFYMLISVILPALAITFMTVITSLINLS